MQPDDPAPGEDVFTDGDLAPASWEVRGRRRFKMERIAAIVAAIMLGVWMGGMLALGAVAAPMVFEFTPYPFSGRAMGAAFQRFDTIAILCSVILLGCEVGRTILTMKTPAARAWLPRLRRYGAIVMALGAVYSGVRLSPGIMELHEQGARRNIGPEGEMLEQLHQQAELIGKIMLPLAVVLIALHILTLDRENHV